MMWLQRAALLAAVVLLGWLVVEQGTGQMVSERLSAIYAGWAKPWVDGIDSISPDSHRVLTTDAWTSLADQALVRGDRQKAEAYAWRGIGQNITSGRPISRLLNVRDIQGKLGNTDQLAELATRLWPMHPDALLRVSSHWIARKDFPKTLQALDALMAQTSVYNAKLFPPLLKTAQSEEAKPLLKQYAASAPSWWPAFFTYLAQNEESLANVNQYYQARQQATKPLSKGEQLVYINRLIREKAWTQARQVWLDSLDKSQQSLDGLLYSGGFESNISNEGFAWYFSSSKQFRVEAGYTSGTNGKQALRITFKDDNKPFNFQQLWQRLVLKPGDYTLTLRYRLDHFDARKGLQWRLRCEDSQELLAETPSLQGYSGWEALTVDFTVPPSVATHDVNVSSDDANIRGKDSHPEKATVACSSQLLRLETASRFAHEQLFKGTLWFDDFSIKQRTQE